MLITTIKFFNLKYNTNCRFFYLIQYNNNLSILFWITNFYTSYILNLLKKNNNIKTQIFKKKINFKKINFKKKFFKKKITKLNLFIKLKSTLLKQKQNNLITTLFSSSLFFLLPILKKKNTELLSVFLPKSLINKLEITPKITKKKRFFIKKIKKYKKLKQLIFKKINDKSFFYLKKNKKLKQLIFKKINTVFFSKIQLAYNTKKNKTYINKFFFFLNHPTRLNKKLYKKNNLLRTIFMLQKSYLKIIKFTKKKMLKKKKKKN